MKTVLVLVAAAGFGAAGYYAQQPVGADTTPAPKAPGVGQDAILHLEPRGAAQPAQPVGAPPAPVTVVVPPGYPVAAGTYPCRWNWDVRAWQATGHGWQLSVHPPLPGVLPAYRLCVNVTNAADPTAGRCDLHEFAADLTWRSPISAPGAAPVVLVLP